MYSISYSQSVLKRSPYKAKKENPYGPGTNTEPNFAYLLHIFQMIMTVQWKLADSSLVVSLSLCRASLPRPIRDRIQLIRDNWGRVRDTNLAKSPGDVKVLSVWYALKIISTSLHKHKFIRSQYLFFQKEQEKTREKAAKASATTLLHPSGSTHVRSPDRQCFSYRTVSAEPHGGIIMRRNLSKCKIKRIGHHARERGIIN